MAVFLAPRVCRGPAVLTTEVLAQVQHLLDEEHSVQDIAKELDLKADALHKALRLDKLRRPLKKEVRLQLVNGNRSPIGLRIGYITKSLEVERSEGVALWPYAD